MQQMKQAMMVYNMSNEKEEQLQNKKRLSTVFSDPDQYESVSQTTVEIENKHALYDHLFKQAMEDRNPLQAIN